MVPIEQESITAFRRLWDVASHPSDHSLEELMTLIHSKFSGYGTAHKEKYVNKESFEYYMNEQFKANPDGFSYKILNIDFTQLSDRIGQVIADLSVEFSTPRGPIPMDLFRVTAVLAKVDGKMLLTQFHGSVPDRATGDDDIIPGVSEPKIYNEVSILFTDFEGFTTMVSTLPAKKLIEELNDVFTNFDRIMEVNNLSKIKIIGDAYMAVAGIKEADTHALSAVTAAKQILEYLEERNMMSPIKWQTRIGIHSGSVVGGVLGRNKLTFDLWGDTVNLASAIEQAGEANKINLSAYTYALIQDTISCEYRGKIEIKDKRMIDMYFVN